MNNTWRLMQKQCTQCTVPAPWKQDYTHNILVEVVSYRGGRAPWDLPLPPLPPNSHLTARVAVQTLCGFSATYNMDDVGYRV